MRKRLMIWGMVCLLIGQGLCPALAAGRPSLQQFMDAYNAAALQKGEVLSVDNLLKGQPSDGEDNYSYSFVNGARVHLFVDPNGLLNAVGMVLQVPRQRDTMMEYFDFYHRCMLQGIAAADSTLTFTQVVDIFHNKLPLKNPPSTDAPTSYRHGDVAYLYSLTATEKEVTANFVIYFAPPQ